MRFGVCAPVSEAARLHKLGFDYIEVSASSLASMTEAEFAAFCAENQAAPIHAEAANCLFPGEIRLTGDAVDSDAVQSYIDRVMARLGAAGIQIAVFGSGGSRRVPEGFAKERAISQLGDVAYRLGEAAAKHGVTVVLEPLRREGDEHPQHAAGKPRVRAGRRAPEFQAALRLLPPNCRGRHAGDGGGLRRRAAPRAHRKPGRPRRDEAGRQGRFKAFFRRAAPRGLRCARQHWKCLRTTRPSCPPRSKS